jgi:hypothetical protein
MPSPNWDEEFFQLLSQHDESVLHERAPSRLKARVYSALVRKQQETGPLMSLGHTHASGHGLCVFERLVQIAPLSESAKSTFFCSACHARMLAENFENAPIFWSCCPYVHFQKG